ncbi:hypothetical protein [Kocuria rhizophila]|uniref:hypothetical protein n=1 Tax=Kocuria rhizophila TaxID=72000 RepID=UPI001EF5103C|nr:hypothetical protein [Kocuria rhizophila]
MSEGLTIALLSLMGVALTVWGTLTVARRSEKAQRRREDTERRAAEEAAEAARAQSRDEALWQRVEDRLKDQDATIASLKTELSEARTVQSEQAEQIRAQAEQLRDVQDREKDRDELLNEYRAHTLAWDLYTESGSVPPPPEYSWRIREDLALLKKEAGT